MFSLHTFASVFFLFFCLSRFQPVIGHGYVHEIIANGQSYPGWLPFSDNFANPPPQKIARRIPNDGFVGAGSPDLACHIGGREGAPLVAEVAAGSQVTFNWQYWPGDHQGPVSTYMASCNGDCTNFDAYTARWFKLDADGYDPQSRTWGAARLIADGSRWVSTIPGDLAPGEYLMRNEIIALHSAGSPQFYPMCAQVRVTGSGTAQPSESDLFSIPDVYNGVTFPNIYFDFGTFTPPGPPPVSFGQGGSNNQAPNTPSPPSATTAEATTPEVQTLVPSTVTSNSPADTYTNTTSPPQTPEPASPAPSPQPSGYCGLHSRRLVRRRLSKWH
ncbi:hypothetical protein AX16_005254 [Volvariella volvacea WC 439]|nr:hypothetical protein AX16_005254 [Volvariella volvacea WC 439]